jgi:hypothetical protein
MIEIVQYEVIHVRLASSLWQNQWQLEAIGFVTIKNNTRHQRSIQKVAVQAYDVWRRVAVGGGAILWSEKIPEKLLEQIYDAMTDYPKEDDGI